jgi:hypothetical protein
MQPSPPRQCPLCGSTDLTVVEITPATDVSEIDPLDKEPSEPIASFTVKCICGAVVTHYSHPKSESPGEDKTGAEPREE